MLSKKEKQEMLADGQGQKLFKGLNLPKKARNYSLDKFIGFLNDFQKIFSPHGKQHKHFTSKASKL